MKPSPQEAYAIITVVVAFLSFIGGYLWHQSIHGDRDER